MRELSEQPVAGPEPAAPASSRIRVWRTVAKGISWRMLGTLDTLLLSYLLITYLGPLFGMEASPEEALQAAGYIAVTELGTKLVLYFLHERAWLRVSWGTSQANGKRRESKRRSTVKALMWRTIASLDTILLAWIFTGSIATAMSIGGLEVVTKLVLYFIHERIWARLSFGIAHDASFAARKGIGVDADPMAAGALSQPGR